MTDRRLLNIAAALAALACFAGASAEAVVFVHSGATGANDGSSWANAFTDLQNAIAAPGATEIWVAAGAYKPGAPGDTTASFTLRSGLALYGGFAGFESAREQRRPDVNATTLSGDLDGDGTTGPGNSAHVVRASGTDTTAVLDGFTISGGYAVQAAYPGSSGAGIFIENGTVTLRSCTIRNHIAQLGAGLLAYNATLTIEDCRFENNLASQGRGGAIYVSGDTGDAVLHPLTLRRCTFTANTATGTGADGYGGGLYAEFDAPVDASECVFIGNESRWRFASGQFAAAGGAALTFADGCKFDRCLFRGNRSHNGGALWLAGNTTLSNCLFIGNEAYRVSAGAYDYGGYGGAIIAYTANVTVAGSTLHANRARSTGGIYVDLNSSALVTNSILWSNTATEEDQKPLDPQIGGASPFTIRYSCVRDLLTPIPGEDPPDPARFPGCIVIDPLFVSERGLDNIAGNADDDLQLRDTSPCLDAGNNAEIPIGATLDFAGTSRRHDVVAKADTGSGFAPITDMGAYEWAPPFLSTLASGAPGQLTLHWSALGAGWQYTAEWTDNIAAPDWQPLPPAGQWPSTATSAAIDTTGLGASAFFRIRATPIHP